MRVLCCLLLLLHTLSLDAWAQGGWTDAQPINPPTDLLEDEHALEGDSTVEEGAGDAESAETATEEEVLRRPRPATTESERLWIEKQLPFDPFMKTFAAIGPALETSEFYDPFGKLKLGPNAIQPQASRYLIQDASGAVQGQLTLRITREESSLYGPAVHISQDSSLGLGEQVDVWQSAISAKPLRVMRIRDLGLTSPDGAGVTVRNIERFDAKYLFDRVTVTKTKGGVTLAAPSRLQYNCFDVAQLPLLLQLLDLNSSDWPFEALLFDSTVLEVLPLQVGTPVRKSIQSAEPAQRDCWELPVRWGNQRLLWYIERASPGRLVKFTFGNLVFTLKDYAELKGP